MEYPAYMKIIATKALPSERMLLEIRKTDIKPHYSSLTDYLDAVVNYSAEGMRTVDKLVERFHLGAVRLVLQDHYGAVVPRINRKGKIVGGNVMYFNVDNGELLRKDPLTDHMTHWYCFDYCTDNDVFFGEHLLSNKPIAVVVEEKTALLGSLALPAIDWLAVGSDYHLTDSMMDRLSGRRVILCPDDVCHDYWQEQFGIRFKVDAGFVSQDINAYLVDRIRSPSGS